MTFNKHVIKSIFQYFGYQVRKCPRASSPEASFLHLDPFFDQQFLLKNYVVDTIFDIGAHVGETTKNYRKFFKNSKIFAFEPFPESYHKLSEFSQSDKMIETHNVAVAEQSEEKSFYSTNFSPMNSLLELTNSSDKYYD